jgi:hypothetical protein
MRTADLARFICEREAVRINKETDKPKPWTSDPILQTYRFCNVRRENDAVTRWLRRHYYPTFAQEDYVGFAAVVARLFNLPASLNDIKGFVLPFKPAAMRRVLEDRKRAGEKNFNAAYIVSTNGVPMDKVQYLIERVLGPLWANRKALLPMQSLEEWHKRLMAFDGLGSFLAAQVIADMKYMPPLYKGRKPTSYATDWWTFAASGPGSRRGLNRVYNYPVAQSWNEKEWRQHLLLLQEALNKLLDKSDLFRGHPLHAQDVQNCLCEFDKYERIRLGEGRPKQLYPGAA